MTSTIPNPTNAEAGIYTQEMSARNVYDWADKEGIPVKQFFEHLRNMPTSVVPGGQYEVSKKSV